MESIAHELGSQHDHRRFYDRMRASIEKSISKRGRILGTAAEFLMLAPDIFVLLWRLTTDRRIGAKDKILLGSAVAYFILPFDFLPEALVGGIGYIDDLIFGVYVLNKLLLTTDPAVLREHWSGRGDILEQMQRVLNTADSLVGSNVLGKVKSLFRRSS